MVTTFKRSLALLMLVTTAIFGVVSCTSTRTQEDANQYVQGSSITAQVKSELMADPDINVLQINVKTYKNVVQLSGFVDTYKQKLKAAQIARNVSGVVAVQDSLVVKSKHK